MDWNRKDLLEKEEQLIQLIIERNSYKNSYRITLDDKVSNLNVEMHKIIVDIQKVYNLERKKIEKTSGKKIKKEIEDVQQKIKMENDYVKFKKNAIEVEYKLKKEEKQDSLEKKKFELKDEEKNLKNKVSDIDVVLIQLEEDLNRLNEESLSKLIEIDNNKKIELNKCKEKAQKDYEEQIYPLKEILKNSKQENKAKIEKFTIDLNQRVEQEKQNIIIETADLIETIEMEINQKIAIYEEETNDEIENLIIEGKQKLKLLEAEYNDQKLKNKERKLYIESINEEEKSNMKKELEDKCLKIIETVVNEKKHEVQKNAARIDEIKNLIVQSKSQSENYKNKKTMMKKNSNNIYLQYNKQRQKTRKVFEYVQRLGGFISTYSIEAAVPENESNICLEVVKGIISVTVQDNPLVMKYYDFNYSYSSLNLNEIYLGIDKTVTKYLQGFNQTTFLYGPSNSLKSLIFFGKFDEIKIIGDESKTGIINQFINDIFLYSSSTKSVHALFTISITEIINNTMYDLLGKKTKNNNLKTKLTKFENRKFKKMKNSVKSNDLMRIVNKKIKSDIKNGTSVTFITIKMSCLHKSDNEIISSTYNFVMLPGSEYLEPMKNSGLINLAIDEGERQFSKEILNSLNKHIKQKSTSNSIISQTIIGSCFNSNTQISCLFHYIPLQKYLEITTNDFEFASLMQKYSYGKVNRNIQIKTKSLFNQ